MMTRMISACFIALTLAIFKPFGLEAWHFQALIHLFFIWLLGIGVCMLTDVILKYVVRMPRSFDKGASYIIRRNLWFQFINTPILSLVVCFYRHFVLSNRVEENQLSWANYFETLLIFAFCSFAIGLYWRFKFRSRYLAAELEETRQLNMRLQKMQEEAPHAESVEVTSSAMSALGHQVQTASDQPPSIMVLTGTTSETVKLEIPDLLYIEAVGNYVKVYQWQEGRVRTDMLRSTSKQVEEDLSCYPMIVRCHRAFLVNLQQVEQVVSKSGTMQLLIKHSHESIPVSRSNMAQVKRAINQ